MVSISELIKVFQKCYNSIEITSVIYTHENTWHNVLTTLYLSQDTMKSPQENVIFNGKNIKILKKYSELSNIYQFFEDLKAGKVTLHGFKIQYENPFDSDALKIQLDWHKNAQETKNAETFFIQRNYNVFNNNTLIDDIVKINPDVIKLGFSDAFDFISYQTGIRKYNARDSFDYRVIIPVFFKINSVEVKDNILKVDLSYTDCFSDLQINVIGYTDDYRNIIFRDKIEVHDKKYVEFTLKNMYPDSRLEVYLFSRSLPEVQLKETIFVPISKPLIPFTQTYHQFHKLDELENLLLKPEILDNKKRSELFERAVCDLLSLCGLSVIHLVDNEILRLDNKTEIGSADILAYDGLDHLFVIDCDILLPDQKKMGNLNHLCRYLRNLNDINEVKHIIPTIVSPNPPVNFNSGVLVIEGAMIKRLFKALHYKNKEDIVSMITEAYFQLQFANARTRSRLM